MMLMWPDRPGPPISEGREKRGTGLGTGFTRPGRLLLLGQIGAQGPFSIFLFSLLFLFCFLFETKAFEFQLISNQIQRFGKKMFSIHLGPRE
jgi:hypothetical protein